MVIEDEDDEDLQGDDDISSLTRSQETKKERRRMIKRVGGGNDGSYLLDPLDIITRHTTRKGTVFCNCLKKHCGKELEHIRPIVVDLICRSRAYIQEKFGTSGPDNSSNAKRKRMLKLSSYNLHSNSYEFLISMLQGHMIAAFALLY